MRAVDLVSLSGNLATLTLASPVAADETVTVGYTPPAGPGATLLRDAAGNAVAGFSGRAVTNETPAPVNTAPTGLPAISGTARVGETLTASVTGIADADGLTSATFAYQWLSYDGATDTDTDIQGATGTGYTLVAADAGKTVKVRVTFTDGGGTQESLVSEATAPVAVAAEPAEVSIAAAASPVTEGADAVFTLSRTGSSAAALTVAVSVTQTGTFLSGAAPATATIAAGDTTATLSVATDDDDVVEADGSVTATIAAGQGYTVGAPDAASVTVADNEVAVDVVVTVSSPVAENEGPFKVTLTATTAEDEAPRGVFLFVVTTKGDTAGEGTDYERLFQVQSFLAGNFERRSTGSGFRYVLTYEFTTAILDDGMAEGDETFMVSLYTLAPGLVPAWVSVDGTPFDGTARRYEVTITDDDAAPAIATVSPILVPENATAVATLEATDADTPAESLSWSVEGGADAGAFTLSSDGVLGFGTAKDFEAPDDADTDGDYEVTVRVTDGANAAEAALTVRLVDVDDVVPALSDATVNGEVLTLTFSEALDGGSVPPEGAFTVEVDGIAGAVDLVSLAGNLATLTLASPVAADETVTVGYTPPAGPGATLLRDAAGNAVAGFSGRAVTNETPAPVNTAPTGLPAISGTARVGETLTASVTGIADADGLTSATFAYQWLSNDGATDTDTDIQGATGTGYTLVAADAGKTVKVRVTFTDGGGTQESLVSEATAPVAAEPAEVSIAAAASPVTEGADAVFTLTRTGDATAALTVAVKVTEAGAVLSGTVPSAVTFLANASEAQLRVSTHDDGAAEADARVTAGVASGAGYRVAAGAGTADIDVLDNDRTTASVTTVWSADMTVMDFGTGGIGAASADLFSNVAGSEDVQVKWLWYYVPDRTLYLSLKQELPESGEVTLHLDGLALAVPRGDTSFTWNGVDLDWTDGETVAVRLTRAGGVDEPAAGPGLSVSDAQVREAAGASLVFRVTLDAAPTSAVSVRYATADGTAKAGVDYVSASGALRFAPGATEKTIEVLVLEDTHDEGSETLSLTLSRPFGAQLSDGQATGTIVNTDPVPKAWLARFGRTVAGHVVDAIGARLTGPPKGDSHVTLGGQRLSLEGGATGAPGYGGAGENGHEAADGLAGVADRLPGHADGGAWRRWERDDRSGDGWMRDDPGDGSRTVTGRELLLGSSFHLALGGDEDAARGADTRWTAWGRAASSRFDGRDGDLTLDGDVTTFTLGADATWSRWLAGVAVSLSEGEGGFAMDGICDGERCRGGLESTLTSVHPYARLEVSERLSVWGILGYGTGELTLEEDHPDGPGNMTTRTDTSMQMAAAGTRSVLVPAKEAGDLEVAARTDVMLTRMRSEAATGEGGNLAATEAGTSRLRLVLEGSSSFAVGDGGALTPSLEVGLRHDGGDAETGTGIEVGGGLSYTDPALGLTVDAKVRGLVAHEDADYAEWGASGSVRIDPGASGRGLSLTLAPTWGTAEGGAERLWSLHDTQDLVANDEIDARSRFDAEIGYGLSVFGDRGVATPHVGWSQSADTETLRLGHRLRLGSSEWNLGSEFSEDARVLRAGYGYRLGNVVDLSLEATRRDPVNDDAPEHGVMLRAGVRW